MSLQIGHFPFTFTNVNGYEKYLKDLGKKIKQERNQLGLNQIVFADRIGIDERHLRRIEHGKTNPSLEILFQISKMLDRSISELLNTESVK